ncbi:MAG: porin family protein [Tannerellaceae bacterium]|nr:porin family protein [Tannerellaceae bacterium]MCD8264943.1 porin family protein [Tannerellaceae bacterium]
MKRVCLPLWVLVMLTVCGGVAKAQWSLSPEFGMAAVKPAYAGSDWRSKVKLGIGVEYGFLPGVFSIKSGLYYTQRGNKDSDLIYSHTEDNTMDVISIMHESNRGFLQLPVLANFLFPLNEDIRLNLAAGAYIAPVLHKSWSYGGGYYKPYPDNGYSGAQWGYVYYDGSGTYHQPHLPGFDWGLSFAAGIEVKNVLVNVGYDYSLGEKESGWGPLAIGTNYHTFTLSVGYKFRLGDSKK